MSNTSGTAAGGLRGGTEDDEFGYLSNYGEQLE